MAAVLAGLLLAACGGSVPTSSTTSAPGASGSSLTGSAGDGSSSSSQGGITVAFSQCMRSHGITNFPDPNASGAITGSGSGSGNPFNPMSPQYQAAQTACQKYLKGGSSSSPANRTAQLNQALKVTACMRAHGYPNFPDPVVSDGNVSFNGSSLGAVSRTQAFQHELVKCQASVYGGGTGSSGSAGG